MANGIHKDEFKRRLGYILLGFFTWYLVGPVRTWVNENVHLSPFFVGIGGILLTLYLFEF